MAFVRSTMAGVAVCGAVAMSALGSSVSEGVADIRATVSVDAGRAEFVGKGAAADAAYPESSVSAARSLHLDAGRNLVFDGKGALVAWLDVREVPCADYAAYQARVATAGFAYPRAVVYVDAADPVLSSVPPTVKTDAAAIGGKPYVDFGEYGDGGSGMWLLFVGPDGARLQVPLRAAVAAVGFGRSAGFLLGDVADPSQHGTATSGNSVLYFHKGKGGGTGEDDAIYQAPSDNRTPYYGETLVDGRRVDPSVTCHVRNGWELFAQNGPVQEGGLPYVSTLFNAGNFKQVYGVNDRQGGGKVGEIVYYETVLTELERQQVEAYLNQKWFGRCTAGTVRVAAGATLDVSAAADVSFETLAGAGIVQKTGTETLRLRSNAEPFHGALSVDAGRVELEGGSLVLPPVAATAGRSLSVAWNGLTAGTAAAAEFAVTGTAQAVAVSSVEADVDRLSASGVTLSLRAPVVGERHEDFFSSGTNLIANGDFEAETIADPFTAMTPAGWSKVSADDPTGLCKGNSAFCNNGPVYSGVNCFYVQLWGTTEKGLRQQVMVPHAGLYTLSFAMRSRYRSGYPNADQAVLVVRAGDRIVCTRVTDRVASVNASTGKFVLQKDEHVFQHESVDVWLDAGTVELTFVGKDTADYTSANADRALLLDDLRLTPKRDGTGVLLADPGFDSVAEVLPLDSDAGIVKASPTGSPWTFGAETAESFGAPCAAGLTRFPSSLCYFAEDGTTLPASDRDHQQLYLHRHAWATTSVEFPTDGNVVLSYRASRGGFGRKAGSVLHVRLDGSDVASVTPGATALTRYSHVLAVTAGRYELKLEAVPPDAATDCVLAVDDVDFRYLGQETLAPVKDFGGPAWEAVPGTATAAQIRNTGADYFEAQLSGDAGVRQTVNLPRAGVYAFAADLVGRFLFRKTSGGGLSHEYHTATNYPHRAAVYVDGRKAADLAVEDSDYRRYAFRLPYLTAGAHELVIRGDAVQSTDRAMTRIRAPELFRLETAATLPDLSDRDVILTDGAKLDLDAPETIRIGRLRVNGKRLGGTLNAANCDFITGPGSAVSELPGLMFLIR